MRTNLFRMTQRTEMFLLLCARQATTKLESGHRQGALINMKRSQEGQREHSWAFRFSNTKQVLKRFCDAI